ncbi:MAG: uncharacterized protein V7608_5221 [Hyphomicrobiales bacterium]
MVDDKVTSLIVIQPTPFCNIDCTYCYLPRRDDRAKLGLEDIRRIFERLTTFPTLPDRVTVVWHAGEPLVLGPAYYDAAFACIRAVSKSITFEHAFQTNAMLIDDRWCDLFQRWNVGLGVSIDGPRHIHDAARKTRDGRGTFDQAIAGVKCLQRRNIPFTIISVLTKAAVLDPDGMFEFYRSLDIRDVGFNIDEQEGIHKASSLGDAASETALTRFFARFGELMTLHQFPIAVRELEETLAAIRVLDPHGPMNSQVTPFGIITIGVDGDVFTFSPELVGYSATEFPTFAIGNVLRQSFEELSASPVLARLTEHVREGVDLCRSQCAYFRLCGGGAPSNKLFENGTFASTETLYCRLTKKRVADFALATIEANAGRDKPEGTG